jgi:iron complex outermembrane receptor protein
VVADQFRPYFDLLSGGAISAVEAQLGPVLGIPPGAFFAPGTGFPTENFTLDDDTVSLFTQLDYDITDALTLTLGLNYTEADRSSTSNVVSTEPSRPCR